VLNDADAAGLGEMRFGAGRGVRGVVVMVTLGTGIGCGYFLNGQLAPNVALGRIEIRGKPAELRASDSARRRLHRGWGIWARSVEEYLAVLDRLVWPDLIVIGGGVSSKADRFLPQIRVRPPLAAAELGNVSGIVGAAIWGAEHAQTLSPGDVAANQNGRDPSRAADGAQVDR
jgi:polyphosphate glucokinase